MKARLDSYIQIALALIERYDGAMPLSAFLKQYFAQHKKHGSRDRKLISHLVYTYYRLGKYAATNQQQRLLIALFLCEPADSQWSVCLPEAWQQLMQASLGEKCSYLQTQNLTITPAAIFPWIDALSEGIEKEAFVWQHLQQPDLFLRVRPGRMKKVVEALNTNTIAFEADGNCLRVANGTKIDQLLTINKDVVVQDRSSQQVANLFSYFQEAAIKKVWDCCAASGGKSILLMDTLPGILLSVSDIRASILHNLRQRFAEAGIAKFQSFLADLSQPLPVKQQYDAIICDVPCSGSGTWGRTPEQLSFFNTQEISRYAQLQATIAGNAIPHLKQGGYLLYITCSVFAAENEMNVIKLAEQHSLKLITLEVFTGYQYKADTMFAALLQKA
ncbi:MAG: Fmu (Sun) domain protein [Chitinophagaceae bacterium]|nr:Fmu (Sun) domain protein [Chitinophagaceae bacterium]